MTISTSLEHRRPRGLPLALALLSMLMAFVVPMAVYAREGQVQLAIRPIEQPGQFFDVMMRPGETRTLAVELTNVGDAPISARTYAADVYTIINGGFGARLRDERQTGTTLWLDYSTDILQLPAGEGIRRTFDIAVPADAAPGEYITSVVLENDEPIRGSGDVAIDQVVRQATAVVVTVPGPREPALVIGAPSHKVVADKSVVAVALRNTGNVRLKPVAEVVLLDGAGVEVSRASVPMDTVYAHSETLVEVPLAALLQPGAYSISLTLEDTEQDVRANEAALPLLVETPPEPDVVEGLVPGLTEVVQAVQEGRVPAPIGIAILGTSLVLGVVIGWLILVLRRRRRARASERYAK